MNAISLPNRGHVQRHVFSFPDTPFARSLPGVTVGAKDLALCNLFKNGRPGETRSAHVGDIVAFVAEVVELEDDWVSLATLDARILG